MKGITTRRLSIALLAQVVFCLVAAPILAAEQWNGTVVATTPKQAPRGSGVTITAVFDASNVRPEEVSDAEQKRGKPTAGVGKAGPGTSAIPSEKDEISTKDTKDTKKGQEISFFFVSFVVNDAFKATIANDRPCIGAASLAEDSLQTPRRIQPAVQPTGPPHV
ncbi:MAG TPA: hypothetical protein VG326_13620 [Tepidisphaeraceae bacterium]|jgi:hypothetical protein|nr:hypothetical protein [Tepidisphaeraceae bacterium]